MMFYTPEQQYLMVIVRHFGCLRVEQAKRILRNRYDTKPDNVSRLIHQLCAHDTMRECDGALTNGKIPARLEMLYAVDVLLAMFEEIPDIVVPTQHGSPFLLTAYSARHNLQVRMLHVPIGSEMEKSLIVDATPGSELPTVLILLLDNKDQRALLHLTQPCAIACPGADGILQIVKSNQEVQKNGEE